MNITGELTTVLVNIKILTHKDDIKSKNISIWYKFVDFYPFFTINRALFDIFIHNVPKLEYNIFRFDGVRPKFLKKEKE